MEGILQHSMSLSANQEWRLSLRTRSKDKLLADFGSSDWAATTRANPPAVIFDLQRAAA
jgi:hypothetical protein